MMMTASTDKTLKIWDVASDACACVYTHDSLDAGAIFGAAFGTCPSVAVTGLSRVSVPIGSLALLLAGRHPTLRAVCAAQLHTAYVHQ
jgi:hypothetical protein